MNRLLKAGVFAIFTSLVIHAQSQNILLVDNSAGAPGGTHVYPSISDALSAAVSGDIIHVKPSTVSYGNFTITTSDISVFGVGFNPSKDVPTLSIFGTINVEASNIRLSGLQITTVNAAESLSGTIALDGLTIDGCNISNMDIGDGNDVFTNVILRNNIIGQLGTAATTAIAIDVNAGSSSVLITNNVISGRSFGTLDCDGGCTIRNNIFIGDGTGEFAFETVSTSTVFNNIFYGKNPAARVSLSDVSFTNNFSVGALDNALGTGTGVTETGTITGISDPAAVFEDANIAVQQFWDFSWDPTIATSATSLINAGNDGTDVGVTGSTTGWSTTGTPLPLIQVMNLSDIVRQGTDLDVSVQAEGN